MVFQVVGVYLDKSQDSWVLSVDNYRGGVFNVWLRWVTNNYYATSARRSRAESKDTQARPAIPSNYSFFQEE